MQFALLIVSAVCACLYGVLLTVQPPSALRTVVKMLAIGALAALCLLTDAPWLLLLALVFGTMGDGFLSRDGDKYFLAGLAAFLIGHICYIFMFLQLPSELTHLIESPFRLIVSIALLATALAVAKQLTPYLGELKLPVYCYVAVSLVLGISALILPDSWPLTLSTFGAFLFIASDIILAYDLFVIDRASRLKRATSRTLWFLYWGGQLLILIGIVQAVP